jgi:hypothetical protein
MTPLQVRLKYKADTGYAPTYGKLFLIEKCCSYKGHLKQEYGQWLEEQMSNHSTDIRVEYKICTSNNAMKYNQDALQEIYTKEYMFWLEEKYCGKITAIESILASMNRLIDLHKYE